jgi:hypothetical protein
MKVTHRGRVRAFRSMLAHACRGPVMIASLKPIGAFDVWAYDGKAYLFPSKGGLIVTDWFAWCRHARRHGIQTSQISRQPKQLCDYCEAAPATGYVAAYDAAVCEPCYEDHHGPVYGRTSRHDES